MRGSAKFDTPIAIESGIVQIYTVAVDDELSNILEYQSYLSKEECDRASRFKFQIDKERFILARAILRILSGYFLGLNPKEVRFVYGAYGKPDYAPKQNLKFNISHSGDMIVLGFTLEHELGVDVEKIKTDFDALKLAQNFFSRIEIEALEKLPKNELSRAFFRCWTRKESFIKAEGSGLSFPLDQFAVSLNDNKKAALLSTDWDVGEKSKWSLFSFVPAQGYIGACAVPSKVKTIRYFDWDTMKSK